MKSLLLVLLVLGWTSITVRSYKRSYRWRKQECDDIAIIGAGIAGTYTGWKLRNLGKKITIYEYSDRVGGRFYTQKFPQAPDINVELGAMRFIPNEHPLLHDLLQKLRLPVRRFEQGSGTTSQTLMYLRGKHLRYDSLGGHDTPYNLGPNERKHVALLKWETYKNGTDADEVNLPEADKKYYIKTTADGVELYKQSVMSVYHKTLSKEALNYIRATRSFPRVLVSEVSSSIGYITSPKPSNKSPNEVLTVTSGFSSVTSKLLERFLQASIRHKIKRNRHLRSIKRRRNGGYNLYFEPTVSSDGFTKIDEKKSIEKYCARKVVLAINRLALERLDWSVLNQPKIKDLIVNSVRDFPAVKIFSCYPYPWWEQSPVYNIYAISDTLLKQTYGFGTSRISPRSSVLLASYSDVATSLWRELAQRNTEYSNGHRPIVNPLNPEIISITHKYLSRIYKISARRIPPPSNGTVAIWDSYPFGGAVQLWNPGYIWEDVEKTMVKPSSRDDVFIVSNAFNSRALSIWSEGALQAVELAMSYLNPKNKQ